LTITANGAAMDAPYVQSLRVDGKPSEASWLPASVVQKGGTLEFELGRAKNTQWGTATLPPSYGPN
jgi:putative alpha-1,2-mannosidase